MSLGEIVGAATWLVVIGLLWRHHIFRKLKHRHPHVLAEIGLFLLVVVLAGALRRLGDDGPAYLMGALGAFGYACYDHGRTLERKSRMEGTDD
jgi:hypothetical protein